MPTLQDCHLNRGLKQVLQADRAILMHGVLDTRVRVKDLVRVATATSVAMEIIVATTDAADATSLAVENLLLHTIIIPEVAVSTKICPEDLIALYTLPARRLRKMAPLADNLFNVCSVYLVGIQPFVLPLIVTMPAPEDLSTAWGHNTAFAPVVPATLARAPR